MNIKHIMNALMNAGVITRQQADDAITWAEDEQALTAIAEARTDGQADSTFFDSTEAEINARRGT